MFAGASWVQQLAFSQVRPSPPFVPLVNVMMWMFFLFGPSLTCRVCCMTQWQRSHLDVRYLFPTSRSLLKIVGVLVLFGPVSSVGVLLESCGAGGEIVSVVAVFLLGLLTGSRAAALFETDGLAVCAPGGELGWCVLFASSCMCSPGSAQLDCLRPSFMSFQSVSFRCRLLGPSSSLRGPRLLLNANFEAHLKSGTPPRPSSGEFFGSRLGQQRFRGHSSVWRENVRCWMAVCCYETASMLKLFAAEALSMLISPRERAFDLLWTCVGVDTAASSSCMVRLLRCHVERLVW